MHVTPSTRPRLSIIRELRTTSDMYGLLQAGWLFLVLVALIALLPVMSDRGWYLSLVMLVPLVGAYAYKSTIVMHECCHRTLFRTRALNQAVGVLCGGLLGSRFDVYCRVHLEHHRHCGTTQDVGDNDYLVLDGAPPRTLALHLLKPLAGITFVENLKLSFRPPAGVEPGPHRPKFRTHERRAVMVQLGVIVVVQGLLAAIASGMGRYPLLVGVFPLAAATFGLFFSRTRAFCEHVSYSRAIGECFVRSHRPNWFDRLFFYTLNMNLHVEHHWFPQLPARHLPRLRAALKQEGYLTPEMNSHSIIGTILGRFREASAAAALVRKDP